MIVDAKNLPARLQKNAALGGERKVAPARICWLTALWVMELSAAALEKLPASAKSQKTFNVSMYIAKAQSDKKHLFLCQSETPQLMNALADRLAVVQSAIARAAQRSGRPEADVELVAVSKTHPPEAVLEALDAGQTLFGESRVQEARAKIALLPSRARWHFIGHLQKNKIRQALGLGAQLFHSVDSLELARDMHRIAEEEGARPRVLLEVNVAGESSKFGFSPEKLRAQIEDLLALGRLEIDGLMTIAPLAPEPEDSRPHFAALRDLRDRLQREFRLALPSLSMGMSGDFEIAIEEGATLVRVGSAIFGSRSGKSWRPSADSAIID
jgi:pyridoxal phosphate enzyme (YggS family)